MNTPVTVMATAGEGGAWGMALLAAYTIEKEDSEKLEDYLSNKVFGDNQGSTIAPQKDDVDGFNAYMERYKRGVAIERAAVENL